MTTDERSLAALLEARRLIDRDTMKHVRAVLLAADAAGPWPRIRTDSTINGIEQWCDDCCDDFSFGCHTSLGEPVDHTEDCPGVAMRDSLTRLHEHLRQE
jgi:hypothetical protein